MSRMSYGTHFNDNGYGTNCRGNNLPHGWETDSDTTTPSILLPATTGLSPGGWLAANAGNKIVQAAMVDATREQCNAFIVCSALQNVGALSSLEAQIAQSVPSSRDRLRVILDGYCYNLAMRMARR